MAHTVERLPLFPLNLVPFPGEGLNLHIFEDRYKALVADCLEQRSRFGIVPYIQGRLCEFGGVMEIAEIVHRYPDGRMDIRTRCVGRFQLLAFQNPLPDAPYAGGRVEIEEPTPDTDADRETKTQLVTLIQRLYTLMESKLDTTKLEAAHLSYALGHKIGLSLDQEYELFLLTHEEEREQYLIAHLSRAIPTLEELDRTRTRIQLNGHFQKFDPLTF